MNPQEKQFGALVPNQGQKGESFGVAETSPENKAILETESNVSYLGVNLKKSEIGEGQFIPKKEQYADFINDKDVSLPLQRDIAIAFLNGEPLLVDGGTSLGKTTTVRKMAADLGWEVHYANLNGATDVEDLMGRYIPNPQKNKPEDPEYIFADGKVTSGLRQEEGKTKIVILDEFNASAPNILIRLHEVLDALERGGEVILSEDASEAVPVNKERTKIIALMNPPGKGYFGREPLDPAQLRRWVYKKLPSELPENTFSYSTNALFGAEPTSQDVDPDLFVRAREEALVSEQLQEIPGMGEIVEKYKEFHKAAKELLKNRKIAEDQPQPFTFDDRMEPRRVRDFVLRFYTGDINETFQQALWYYYANKLESESDRKKLGELIRLIEYTPKIADSKRRGLERGEIVQGKEDEVSSLEYLAKSFGRGKEKITPGQLVKGADGQISVFVGVSKIDGSPVLKPYSGEESTPVSATVEMPEEIKKKRGTFLKETFSGWGVGGDKIEAVEVMPISRDPKKLKAKDWDSLKNDVDEEAFGQYALNPEMERFGDADFEQMTKLGKVKVEKLPDEWNGKPLAEVASYIMKTYGKKYMVPGIEYWQWLSENPDLAPAGLKDGQYHFLFGSTLRFSSGHWHVPYLDWSGAEWGRGADGLVHDWHSRCRVVLLEK